MSGRLRRVNIESAQPSPTVIFALSSPHGSKIVIRLLLPLTSIELKHTAPRDHPFSVSGISQFPARSISQHKDIPDELHFFSSAGPSVLSQTTCFLGMKPAETHGPLC